ncbi:MAG: hypothetical protein U5K56_13150 [Halioglobus sp.]|nr:hypothetical protein [Halioglobus sp.]
MDSQRLRRRDSARRQDRATPPVLQAVPEIVTAALRRGHNQVVAQRHVDGREKPDRLELWSVPRGDVLASNDVPAPRGPDGSRWSWSEFRTATLDGNVIFTAVMSEGGRSDEPMSTAAWMEVSPEGGIVGRAQSARGKFETTVPALVSGPYGGAGTALAITRLDDQGLSDLIESLSTAQIGGREMRAVVRSETRLAERPDTGSVKLGPALERNLMWVGEMSVSKDLSGFPAAG